MRHEELLIGRLRATEIYTGTTNGGLGTMITATAAEINNVADVSAKEQTLTESGAITPGVQHVILDHTTVAIAATIADAADHPGFLFVETVTEPGAGQDHTVVLTSGTWDGTNDIATFADALDALLVYINASGDGTILVNTGSVALSSS